MLIPKGAALIRGNTVVCPTIWWKRPQDAVTISPFDVTGFFYLFYFIIIIHLILIWLYSSSNVYKYICLINAKYLHPSNLRQINTSVSNLRNFYTPWNQRFSDVFRGYRKRPVTWNGLKAVFGSQYKHILLFNVLEISIWQNSIERFFQTGFSFRIGVKLSGFYF